MIAVCARGVRGECFVFSNKKLDRALAFARIGSQTGGPRTVTICGELVRTYVRGKKVGGGKSVQKLRARARRCS